MIFGFPQAFPAQTYNERENPTARAVFLPQPRRRKARAAAAFRK